MSTSIEYKGKTYYVNSNALEFKSGKAFAFEDPELTRVAKVRGKTLIFSVADIEEKLKA